MIAVSTYKPVFPSTADRQTRHDERGRSYLGSLSHRRFTGGAGPASRAAPRSPRSSIELEAPSSLTPSASVSRRDPHRRPSPATASSLGRGLPLCRPPSLVPAAVIISPGPSVRIRAIDKQSQSRGAKQTTRLSHKQSSGARQYKQSYKSVRRRQVPRRPAALQAAPDHPHTRQVQADQDVPRAQSLQDVHSQQVASVCTLCIAHASTMIASTMIAALSVVL